MSVEPIRTHSNEYPDQPAGTPFTVEHASPRERALHENAVAAYQGLQRSMVKLFFYLGLVEEAKAYKALGCHSMFEYTRRLTQLPDRRVTEILTLCRRMRVSPELANAVKNGVLSWRKALLISQFAILGDPTSLIDTVKNLSTAGLRKELQRLREGLPSAIPEPVQAKKPLSGRGYRPQPATDAATESHQSTVASQATSNSESGGGFPSSIAPATSSDVTPREPARKRKNRHFIDGANSRDNVHYLTIRFSNDQFIRWQAVVSERGERLVERLLQALAGDATAEEPGVIVMLHCPECGKTVVPTSRGEIEIERPLLETTRGDTIIEDSDGHRRSQLAPSVRQKALRNARYTCQAKGCHNTRWLDIHHRIPRAEGGTDDLDNLVVLCRSCHLKLHQREEALRRANKRGRP